MHNPVTAQKAQILRTGGISLELFHCSHDIVRNWQDPILRSTFWRCYLATSPGAAIASTSQEWALLPRTICIIPPDSPIRGKARGPFSLYYAHFNCSVHLHDSTPLFMSAPDSVETRLATALAERNEHGFQCSMLELTAHAIGCIPDVLIRAPVADIRIEKAYRLLKENLDTRLRNKQLASWLNMSEASLLRLFKSSVGASPQKEHLRLRLERAADLLRDTEETIESIAEACGFWDRNHFTRVFTREWHDSPARYRRSATSL